MDLRVYRLVPWTPGIAAPAVSARATSPATRGERVLGAYDSAELAAFGAADLVSASRALLRQTLRVPRELQPWCETLGFAAGGLHEDGAGTRAIYGDYLRENGLLGVWLPSAVAPQQHLVLFNTLHAAFSRIEMEAQQVVFPPPGP